ncbi:MAG TPA: hypothetical protein VLC09_04505, partial [Polyangiaceae bacterium]|nr:hypothetical protein [Polyangiaceae bacterium]
MSDARPSVPPFDGEPVSSRGVNSRDFLARLSDASSAADFVPGRRAARAGSGPALQPLDVHQLAQEVASFAETEPSPAVRARALSTAGVLWSRAGSPVEGREALAAAAQLSGKLASVAAELRAVADANDEATVDASLEAAARLAAQPASRHHAALLRALGSLAAGDEPRATALLDHVQRSGGTDPRIAMLRWLLRQAAGQTTVGLDLPPAFAEAAARVGELSSGRASEQAASYLELVRAARHLSRNETEAAAQALVRRPLLSSRPLAVELLASRPEHRQQAETLRRELLTTSPSTTSARLAWRAWLQARAAGGADTAPPSTESLVAAEQALAAALLQASPAAEGLASASSSSGIDTAIDAELAAILAPPGDVAWPDSRHQAEVRLGATLTHSSESWSRAEGTERTGGIEEGGDEDGGEGSEGGSLTLALLAVEAASRRGRSDEVAERLDALAERTGRTEAGALAALLREKHGVAPPDGAVWRELPQLGLLAVAQTHDAEQRLAALENEAERSSNAELSADLWLEAALRRDGSERVEGLTRAARTYGEAGLWLATWAYQAGGGAPSQADDEARSALASSGDPWLERWARLDRAWAQGLEAGGALEQLVEEFPQDGLLRRAAEWLAGHAPTGERIPSRWQAAQRAAHAWFGGDDSAAFQELSNASAAEGLARTLLDELGETLGQTARESERLLEVLRGDDDPERLRAYTRLAALDRSRGDMASALLWQKTAVEEFPEDLGAVLDLEASILTEGRILEWPYVRERLARLLPPEERQAYVELGVVMALGALAEREARAKWESGRGDAPSSLVGLRLDYSQALATGDDARVAELSAQLAERASSDLDRAALLLEA